MFESLMVFYIFLELILKNPPLPNIQDFMIILVILSFSNDIF